MSDGKDIIERHELILDELARLGLSLARELHADAFESQDPDQRARLAQAFHQVSRGVRQSVALLHRLKRDDKRGVREDRDDALAQDQVLRRQRLDQVRARVERVLRAETEGLEAVTLSARLQLALASELDDPDLLAGPLEPHVARLCKTLGLPPQDDAPPLGALSAKLTEGVEAPGAAPTPPRRSSA